MSERDERAADERVGGYNHGGDVWAPHDVQNGMAGVSWLALVFGVVALVLAVIDRFPLGAFLLSIIGMLLGLRLFLPRLTTRDKVLLPIGALTSLVALVVLLLHLAQ